MRHQLLGREVVLVGLIALFILGVAVPVVTGFVSGGADIERAFRDIGVVLLLGWWVIAIVYALAAGMTVLLRGTGRLVLHLLGAGAILGVPVSVLLLFNATTSRWPELLFVWGLPILARIVVIPWTARPRAKYFVLTSAGIARRSSEGANAHTRGGG